MHRACCRFMPRSGITETLSDVESVRVVHNPKHKDPSAPDGDDGSDFFFRFEKRI